MEWLFRKSGEVPETERSSGPESTKKAESELDRALDSMVRTFLGEDTRENKEKRDAARPELPAVFDGLSKSDKCREMESLAGMSDEELTAYLEIAAKEPALTEVAKYVADRSGGELRGLEHRLKTPSSTLEKMRDRFNPVEIGKMSDIIRYTEIHPPDQLAAGARDSLNVYEAMGYTVESVRNTWLYDRPRYKGINATLVSPDGQKFEVQYHTRESFDLKMGVLHELYEEWRQLDKNSPRAIMLEEIMQELSSRLKVPDRIEEVRNR